VTAAQLVSLEGVSVSFRVGWKRRVAAVNEVSVELRKGEIFGLIGESGSGKSTLARALVGLVPISAGRVSWADGRTVTPEARSRTTATQTRSQMVFQDPHSALDPRRTILQSVREPLDVQGGVPHAERSARALEKLELVGLTAEQGRRYPHQLSGGQKQRANIARALVTDPELLICDESVAALDVALQAEILNLIQDLRDRLGVTVLFISHDLSVVAHIATRIGVMYLGEVVEVGTAAELAARPLHPYTEALLSAQPMPVPSWAQPRDRIVLSGDIPSPISPPSGCRFHTRCQYAVEGCSIVHPERDSRDGDRSVACIRADELVLSGVPVTILRPRIEEVR